MCTKRESARCELFIGYQDYFSLILDTEKLLLSTLCVRLVPSREQPQYTDHSSTLDNICRGREFVGLPSGNANFAQVLVNRGNPPGKHLPDHGRRDPVAFLKTKNGTQDIFFFPFPFKSLRRVPKFALRKRNYSVDSGSTTGLTSSPALGSRHGQPL